jgi:hypothetical protein
VVSGERRFHRCCERPASPDGRSQPTSRAE